MNSQIDFSKINAQQSFVSLLNSIDNGQLANSNLIFCRSLEIADSVALAIAQKVLNTAELETCVDFFHAEPMGAMHQISVDQIRELRRVIYLSPKICTKKVVIISEGNALNRAAANAFLKVLEEPPTDTVIIITTANLHGILPTILSRCSVTRLQQDDSITNLPKVTDWLSEYSGWLGSIVETTNAPKGNVTMAIYRLLTHLDILLAEMVNSTEMFKDKKEIYSIFLQGIAHTTAKFFRKNQQHISFFPKVIECLDSKSWLLSFNVNFMNAMEAFLLEVLRLSEVFE